MVTRIGQRVQRSAAAAWRCSSVRRCLRLTGLDPARFTELAHQLTKRAHLARNLEEPQQAAHSHRAEDGVGGVHGLEDDIDNRDEHRDAVEDVERRAAVCSRCGFDQFNTQDDQRMVTCHAG